MAVTPPDLDAAREPVFNTVLFMEAIYATPQTAALYADLLRVDGAMAGRGVMTEASLTFSAAETVLLATHPEIGWDGAHADFESTLWACAHAAVSAAATGPTASSLSVLAAVRRTFTHHTGVVLPTPTL